MAEDIFFVDAGVVALLALERLVALVVEHVLLQDRQTDRQDSQGTVCKTVGQTVLRSASATDTLSEDQRLQR